MFQLQPMPASIVLWMPSLQSSLHKFIEPQNLQRIEFWWLLEMRVEVLQFSQTQRTNVNIFMFELLIRRNATH
jgi:hypothetical protein